MSLIPHFCDRIDCEHNHNYNGNQFCRFFSGDLYFLDCLKNGTMYEPKQPKEPPTEILKLTQKS